MAIPVPSILHFVSLCKTRQTDNSFAFFFPLLDTYSSTTTKVCVSHSHFRPPLPPGSHCLSHPRCTTSRDYASTCPPLLLLLRSLSPPLLSSRVPCPLPLCTRLEKLRPFEKPHSTSPACVRFVCAVWPSSFFPFPFFLLLSLFVPLCCCSEPRKKEGFLSGALLYLFVCFFVPGLLFFCLGIQIPTGSEHTRKRCRSR